MLNISGKGHTTDDCEVGPLHNNKFFVECKIISILIND